jgi:hypothetical protein
LKRGSKPFGTQIIAASLPGFVTLVSHNSYARKPFLPIPVSRQQRSTKRKKSS